ncbi:MAG: PBP1A family penicillin-binding protein [Candidatus Moranbacteria bacterium]|nr:PBP1A family penicillin-binding protein [Candidatus Moranbacteria bacterium]
MTVATLKKSFTTLFLESIHIAILVGSGIIFGLFAIYLFGIPSIDHIRSYPWKLPSVIYDRTGQVELYRLYDEENRTLIPHDAIPDSLRLATIASEDAQFYIHKGINPLSILRALEANIASGRIKQGGSTITQQLARALFLNNERTLIRKVREALLAIKIDHAISKEAILDLYLNTVPYGSNTYGVEQAAQMFFQKSARDLSLDESALLAALPNAPTYFSPYKDHVAELKTRQKSIITQMYTLGLISRTEFATAVNTDTFVEITQRQDTITAPHFVFTVLEELQKKYSEKDLRTKGFRIVTTLDLDLQHVAEQVVREGAAKNMARGASNAALVAINAKTGDILAMVGSKDYYDYSIDGNVNVTTEKRQPGSAFKPFAYATAFEKGFQPETIIYDTPINFGPDGSGKDYIPRNYAGRFHGRLTMRQALAMSLNVPAVQTLALAGVADTINLATRLGITTLTDPKRYGLSLVLGGAEVRPLDMANAFSVFGQEGRTHPVTSIAELRDRDGNRVALARKPTGEQVLSIETARKINSILSDNASRTPIFGPRSPLAFPPGITVAAKTGTTQNFRDAWTVGYTPSIAAAVWVGNNDNRPMADGADGIFVAAPIWRAFIDQALKQFPETGFVAYERESEQYIAAFPLPQTKTIYIDKKTGREISPEKARKMKKGRVEQYTTGNENDTTTPKTLSEVRALYQKNP